MPNKALFGMKLSVLFLCGLLATFQGIQAVCTASSGGSPCSGSPPFCDVSLGTSAACVLANNCSPNVPYGDPSTGSCVASCPAANPYVDLQHFCIVAGACTSTTQYTDAGATPKACTNIGHCSTNYPYQDSTAKQCVAAGACVTAGQYTDPTPSPKVCVAASSCNTANPYGDPSTGSCVASCPAANPYVDLQHYCIVAGACTSTTQYTDAGATPKACTNIGHCSTNYPYQDSTAKQCVAAGACVTAGQYTDPTPSPKVCVAASSCNTANPYGDPSTGSCVAAGACNSANAYQDPTTKTCVVATGCNSANPYSDAGASPKACVVATSCSSGLPYGDPTAKACVAAGACNSANAYQDPTTKTCVAIGSCNSANAYADPTPSPKVCVAATSCNTANPYGDPSTGQCVTTCPTGSTASATTKLCSATSTGTPSAASTGTPSAASISATNFVNQIGPNKVWDATNSTDSKWYAGMAMPLALFGPGKDNLTVYAYGVAFTSASSPYSGATITARSINATLVSNSVDTKEASVISDTQAKLTDQIQNEPSLCVGYGSLGMIYPSSDGTNNQLHFTVVTGSSATIVPITSTTPAAGTVYNFMDYQCWYDTVGIYYVAWTTQSAVTSGGSTTYTESAVSAQAVNATTVKTMWSNQASVQLTNPSANGGGYTALAAGGSSSSNSSTVYLAYFVIAGTGASAVTTISLTSIAVSSTAGTVNTTKSAITTNTASASYAPAGIVSSNYMNGLVISGYSGSGGMYQLYNISIGTLGNFAVVSTYPSSYTTLSPGQDPNQAARGWTSGSGYGIAVIFQTDGSLSYVYQTSYQNGTINATIDVGTVNVPSSGFTSYYPANFFVDQNGALWFGYTQFDSSTGSSTQGNAIQGYLGKLVAQVYNSSTGDALISLFTLLLIVMGSLWVF